ncbi:uncharacterized protein LOC126746895 [Anthonomus grandis grandis]|uniref:uncharacterized protein LOC126746895 n=1 Tax=Anthonomus grandis grandis TaxID=2921223 RepID=UPI002165A531|nr:uncharacterized protein LOC126746895 [Anthonomus grandis grandis]
MNRENFMKWLEEKLILNIPANSVVIFDNAPYHSVQENKVPTKSSSKKTMIDWLTANASQKLEVNRLTLVLEANGTPVDEEILPHVSSEILILLSKDEIWVPQEASFNSATATTITNNSQQSTHDAQDVEHIDPIEIIDQYPNIFRDVDEDGVVLGDWSHSLVCKLQDRNNYLNRPHKRKTTAVENPVSSKKRLVSARAGCINWAPPNNKENNSPVKDDDKNIQETNENFYNILEKTYSEHRSFINTLPSFTNIKEK